MVLMCVAMAVTAQVLPYQDARLSAELRADDLLGRLTLEEKVSLMMNGSPAIGRLGVPQFEWWAEALHGVGRNGYATVFPITMAMAASWDDVLLHKVFTAVGDEGRVKAQQARNSGNVKRYQGLSFWTPNINIFRDPRWGRGQETYGEDPYLTSKMGLAVVRGLQGYTYDGKPLGNYKKLLACAKHFAVHSGPEWNRHEFNVENLPERDLWETYLPAFKALVQEGQVAEIMCAYQRIDGQPCCGQQRYEQQILRDEWGFDGVITSDCGAIRDFLPRWHNVAKDGAEASAKAVLAGTDVECGSEYRHLTEAVRRGDIQESDIDRSLRRLLIARFEVGDFDSDEVNAWSRIPESVVASKEHQALATEMALKSIVLLQNNNRVLPLGGKGSPTSATDIVVMGPNATDSVMMWGNYTGYPLKTVTALEGITARARMLDANSRVRYVQGCGLTRNEQFESRFSEIRDPQGRQGLQATYWNNTEMQGAPATVVNMREALQLSNGGNTVFAPGVNLDHFSARYEGVLTPTRDETLIFSISGDDLMRLTVNGDTLADIKQVRHRVQGAKKELQVKAGKEYRIQIDYVQEEDFAALSFDVQHRVAPTREELLAQIGDTKTVIFVGGISASLEGEEMKVSEPGFKGGDRTSIELPQAQRDMLRMLHEAGKKVVFVNCSGSAIALLPETKTCDAIVQWWYAGEQGGTALAEILFGDKVPSGKLPVTFYKRTEDLPDFLDYSMKNRTYRYYTGEALFPFGYGLSYTRFETGKPVYKDNKVYVQVKNTGKRAGTETVQVYIRNIDDPDGPLKSLRGYRQVTLQPGQKETLAIDLPRERFEGWDAATNTMRVVPGRYEVMVGSSSADKDLKKTTVVLQPVAQPPLVYSEENTGSQYAKPVLPEPDQLPVVRELPDALEGVSDFAGWEQRRNHIGAQIQHYGIGEKPAVKAEQVKARMDGDTLFVDVTVGSETLTLRSVIRYPKTGTAPYALMIGTDMIALPRPLFEDRPVATTTFTSAQVNDYKQFGKRHDRGEHNFDRLYPDLKDNGAYSEWAWGMSRLIDGLQQLGPEVTKIDVNRIGVTGCSYAGKMALYCGAFDERIALTIAQEPGGGGAAAWRKSHEFTLAGKNLEDIDKTDYHWFLESQRENFRGDSVYRLPYDQHELCAMVCPRALLLLGNPDYEWLADGSMLMSAKAAREVWKRFGIEDRMGWSVVDGHGHCQLPESQWPEVQAFIDKFLLGRPADTNNVRKNIRIKK